MFHILILLHIISGILCLILGLLSFLVKKKRGLHTIFGELYHGSYVVVFLSAIVTSVIHWQESSYLFFIALFSYGLALFGYLARKRRPYQWLSKHIIGMTGSYIGIITAVLVVNVSKLPVMNDWPALLFWFLPTIVGAPMIMIMVRRVASRG